MNGEKFLNYGPEIEKEACQWIGNCLNKQVANYEALANGIDLLNMLSHM